MVVVADGIVDVGIHKGGAIPTVGTPPPPVSALDSSTTSTCRPLFAASPFTLSAIASPPTGTGPTNLVVYASAFSVKVSINRRPAFGSRGANITILRSSTNVNDRTPGGGLESESFGLTQVIGETSTH